VVSNSDDPIIKANLSWSRSRAKFCQLIASLFVILSQFYLTKLKLEYLKFGFKCKKERKKQRRKLFASLEFDFFRVQLKLALRIRPRISVVSTA